MFNYIVGKIKDINVLYLYYCFSRHGSNYEPYVISKPCYMAQSACAMGHAWLSDTRGLIVWRSHALKSSKYVFYICYTEITPMDLKKILHQIFGWIVLSGATNVQCHCCVTKKNFRHSTARCANRVESARSVARGSKNRLNHRTKENFTRKANGVCREKVL